MMMETLKTVLTEARKTLMHENDVQDNTYRDLRRATSLSKQSILLVHQKRMKEAEKSIREAGRIILRIRNAATTYPRIVYCGLFSAALQEYSEANIFQKLVQESRFVRPDEINASAEDYVLGLADVVGECRRLTLNALREGDIKNGERYLQTMDQIYIELMAMDESYMLVPGLRRKCDVARKIIEITRGDVTQEIRRDTLEKHLKELEKYVKTKK
jgi:translin